jgi:hypothetical protein
MQPSMTRVLPKTSFKSADTDALIAGLLKKDKMAVENFYNLFAPSVYGVIKKTLMNEELAISIFEKTFQELLVRISEYNPLHESLLLWTYKLARKQAKTEKTNIVLRQIFNC